MPSAILIATAIESLLGAILTGVILYLVLKYGRKVYHYLFAAFLLICIVWDGGTFLLMARNTHLQELETIGYVIGVGCVFIPALLFHFACEYTGRIIKWAIVLGWGICGILWILGLTGYYWKVDGVYTYEWGNIFRVAPGFLDPWAPFGWFGLNLAACWMLYQRARKAASPLERRHAYYLTAGFLVITFAILKAGVVMGIDVPILLPLGMFLADVFNAIMGVAIIKDKLFDITLVVSKGTLYSILAGLLIIIYSLTEHILVTYFGELIGGDSEVANIFSIALGIGILMPVKRRLEQRIDAYFAQRRLAF